jgi:small subunit ribosomal protein S2
LTLFRITDTIPAFRTARGEPVCGMSQLLEIFRTPFERRCASRISDVRREVHAAKRDEKWKGTHVSTIVVKDILEAGVHFGHRTSRWNPKMRPYIYGKRNQIHIIDIKETVRGLLRAKKYLAKVSTQGSLVLFVGTKRQAQNPIIEAAAACGMPYVSERWLGGTFTNFRTIRNRLRRLEELEGLVTTGEINAYSKKMQSTLGREREKIFRNLNGIRTLNRLPEAVVVVDPTKEHNCVHECRIAGIKVVSLIDTDSDPDKVDLPIPGNDDSIRSIRLILGHLAEAVMQGKSTLPAQDKDAPAADEPKAVPSLA